MMFKLVLLSFKMPRCLSPLSGISDVIKDALDNGCLHQRKNKYNGHLQQQETNQDMATPWSQFGHPIRTLWVPGHSSNTENLVSYDQNWNRDGTVTTRIINWIKLLSLYSDSEPVIQIELHPQGSFITVDPPQNEKMHIQFRLQVCSLLVHKVTIFSLHFRFSLR